MLLMQSEENRGAGKGRKFDFAPGSAGTRINVFVHFGGVTKTKIMKKLANSVFSILLSFCPVSFSYMNLCSLDWIPSN